MILACTASRGALAGITLITVIFNSRSLAPTGHEGRVDAKTKNTTEKFSHMHIASTLHNSDIEQLALEQGRLRYLKRQDDNAKNKGEVSRDNIASILKLAVPIAGAQIAKELDVELTRNTPFAVRALQGLDPDLIALVGLSRMFNAVVSTRRFKLTRIASNIGIGIEDELWAVKLLKTNPALSKRLTNRAMRAHGNVKHRRKSVKAVAKKAGFVPDELPSDNRIQIGLCIINVLLHALPAIFEIRTVKRGPKDLEKLLLLTDEASTALLEMTDKLQWLEPVYKPMVERPYEWTDFDTGAYHDRKLARTVKLVKTHDADHISMVREAIADGSMSYCLEALNAIQNTEWRINTRIRELVRLAWDNGLTIDDFPRRELLPMPDRLDNWETLSEERKKGRRIQAAKIAESNRAIKSDRVNMMSDLSVADMFDGHKLYLPHNMDFRGRVYARPHFNQQRGDHVKAMLEFHNGKPLGEDGEFWLAIHVANCGDFNKISKTPLQQRVQWVEDNHDLITRVASDPMGNFDIWSKADKPFQFVAACIEWHAAHMLVDPSEFVSHLPISLDGSNSGLQHYAAALRSPEGALVNLTPQDVPADLYQAVADIVTAAAEEDAIRDSKYRDAAQIVLANRIDRKLVKRNAMTFAYSSKQYGFKNQQMDDLMKPLSLKVLTGELPSHPYGIPYTDKDGVKRSSDDGFACANYIAKKTWSAINDLVQDASRGMEFFQRCAQILAHEGKGLRWVTPIGLPVLHKYHEYTTKTMKMFLYDKAVPIDLAAIDDKIVDDGVLKQVRLTVRVAPSSRINKREAVSAVAPNVIHSLDAAHLMLTVLECKDNGITDFSLVHDSFAVHAADTSKLFALVREAFVGMYESYCPFEEVHASVMDAMDDKSKVPPIPEKGDLDLNLIKESEYAFA